MSHDDQPDGPWDFAFKVGATIVILLLAPFGLVGEPGPLSETLSLAALATIWGLPLLDDSDAA